MKENVIDLACELVAIPSETGASNVAVIDYLEDWLTTRGFDVERVGYTDPEGEKKYNLIAKRGTGSIDQAHTIGEWIDLKQIEDAVEIYGTMIEMLCH